MIRATRTPSGVAVKASEQQEAVPLDLSFVDAVKEALPSQPWPKGIHKEVAEQLGAPSSRVQKAIQELIKSGVFKHQVDGVVIEDSATEPEAPAQGEH